MIPVHLPEKNGGGGVKRVADFKRIQRFVPRHLMMLWAQKQKNRKSKISFLFGLEIAVSEKEKMKIK